MFKALSRSFPEETEKRHKNLRITGGPSQSRLKHLPNTRLEPKLFCSRESWNTASFNIAINLLFSL
jgi:hypothetical protein